MPRHYPAELRRRTCERMLAGLGIAQVTHYEWRRQRESRCPVVAIGPGVR